MAVYLLLQEPGFPCVVLQFYIVSFVDVFLFFLIFYFLLTFFLSFFLFLPDSRDRSPGARGILGLGDEV